MRNTGFFTKIRRWLFMQAVEREIYHKVFCHLNHEADHGYSFFTDNELLGQNVHEHIKLKQQCHALEAAAAKMPEAYGQAFRNIAFRDLNARMEEYIRLAKQRGDHGINEEGAKLATA